MNVGIRAKSIYLPAEVCEVLHGQVSRTRLAAEQTSNMIRFAKCNIVAVKQHHTRFHPNHRKEADKLKNARYGTVGDRGITQARTWDFLQSHSVISGGKIYGPNGKQIGEKLAGMS